MKTCSKCKIEKPFEDFRKRKASNDGYRGQCKACQEKIIAKYHNSPGGRLSILKAQSKYRNSPKGKAVKAKLKAKYNALPEGKLSNSRYSASPKGRATAKRYRSSPKGKATNVKYRRENFTPSPEWETKKHLPHNLYLIRFTQGNSTYIKVGLTYRTTKARFAKDTYHSKMNNLEILDVITFKDFETCNIAESVIHDATLDSHVTPVIAFGGSVNECRLPEATEQIQSMFDSARAAMDN